MRRDLLEHVLATPGQGALDRRGSSHGGSLTLHNRFSQPPPEPNQVQAGSPAEPLCTRFVFGQPEWEPRHPGYARSDATSATTVATRLSALGPFPIVGDAPATPVGTSRAFQPPDRCFDVNGCEDRTEGAGDSR